MTSIEGHAARLRGWRPRVALLAAAFALVMAACGPSVSADPDPSTSRIAIPPDSAPPAVVLAAYLAAMQSGDCATADLLVLPTFRTGNGELCGAVALSAYRSTGVPLPQSGTEIILGTVLTTGGSTDGSIPAGELLWSYDLARQPSGAWRIVSAGQG